MSQSELCRLVLLAVFLAATTPALAQDFINPGENAYASATPEDVRSRSDDAGAKIVDRVPIEIDPATLSKMLSSESLTSEDAKVKPLRRPGDVDTAKWNRVDNPDGSASYSVNRPLAAPWDAKVGADVSTATPLPQASDPRQLPSALPSNAGSGSAWANVAVPYFATVEVRAEPGNGYDKVGTKFERSIPLGKSFSVTAQSTVGVTELRPIPGTVTPSADAASRLFSTDNSLQLNVLATGTSLAAGTSTVTGDPITHSRVSAGQKIYGPLNVTGTVNDPGQTTRNMSLTAGMNFNW